MTLKTFMKTKLIAPCGMNCAICLAFLREKNRCDGCWSPERKCNKNCTIRSCIHRKGKYCFDCDSFPCKKLQQFEFTVPKKFTLTLSENLHIIKIRGIHNFIKTEKNRYKCSKCGGIILCSPWFLFHMRGKERMRSLFKLKSTGLACFPVIMQIPDNCQQHWGILIK